MPAARTTRMRAASSVSKKTDFLVAGESVYLAMHGRVMHVRFRPLEQRGVRWSLQVLVYISDPNDVDGGDPPSGAGIRAFDKIRAVGTATIPYVCVLTPWGERLFGAVDITTGTQAEPAHFALDVGRRADVVLGAEAAAHHRVVGIDVEPGHQVAGRDRRGRHRPLVLERERLLCRGRGGEGDERRQQQRLAGTGGNRQEHHHE